MSYSVILQKGILETLGSVNCENQTPFSKYHLNPRMEDASFKKMAIPEIYNMQQKKKSMIQAPNSYIAKIQFQIHQLANQIQSAGCH